MKRNILRIVSLSLVIGLMLTSCKTNDDYQLELNYVTLANGTKVTAQPVKSTSVDLSLQKDVSVSFKVELDSIIHPNLSGIGGAFNEMGGDAFVSLSAENQKELSNALFNTTDGSGLSNCRTAVGSSDFGLSAYSYSETPGDYTMEHFSIAREKSTLIPFLQAAYKVNPQLKMFASPWSPPGWMKESGTMDGGDKNVEQNILKKDPKIYEAYALYFAKYIKAYKENGITIDRLVIQNETDMNPGYPGNDMQPEEMADLVSDYIIPQFKESNIDTELWAGSFRGKRKDAQKFMSLEKSKNVTGVGLQYCPPSTMEELLENHPDIKIMHTEGRCDDGKNSMKQARKRFSEVSDWLNSGSENFCYWNIILNETSTSGWGWKQNSLININRTSGELTYNSDYAPISLLSQYIRPGDQSLVVNTPENKKAIAVKNKDRVVVFLENNEAMAATQNIELKGKTYAVNLPAESLCAFVFKNKA
ncbi:glycoside hydrolase family 30 protein [Polaribacter sp. Asnod1-A03]|uniref:glycoside hydrolase family 30 protein n=1 Tax=Polaribacter sp. Asnod1-A03 TaxID=3160581 RepID=UPI003863DBD8